MKTIEQSIKLTGFSHGAGCGCKISPSVLETILKSDVPSPVDPRLLVGNESRDDAAVYDMGDGTALISTTDFFMPIVDDPFTFGKIAAANAISDIYAMGGKPLLAIAILGWPIAKIEAGIASRVVEGGRDTCREAGIVLAGGHSIDSPEPLFGLAVTGQVPIAQLKRNDTAEEGCLLFLTKPLGVGILTTARKQGVLQPADEQEAVRSMTILNSVGTDLQMPWRQSDDRCDRLRPIGSFVGNVPWQPPFCHPLLRSDTPVCIGRRVHFIGVHPRRNASELGKLRTPGQFGRQRFL